MRFIEKVNSDANQQWCVIIIMVTSHTSDFSSAFKLRQIVYVIHQLTEHLAFNNDNQRIHSLNSIVQELIYVFTTSDGGGWW